jgi:ankyrin repeat protein
VRAAFEGFAGPDVDGIVRGVSALYAAAYAGHLAVVAELLDRGADVNARVGHGRVALGAAAAGGHLPVLLRLLEAGARPDEPNEPEAETPLHAAARAGLVAANTTVCVAIRPPPALGQLELQVSYKHSDEDESTPLARAQVAVGGKSHFHAPLFVCMENRE